MYNLGHIRRRVESLKRRFAPALTVIRLRRLSQEFCDQWEASSTPFSGTAPPKPNLKTLRAQTPKQTTRRPRRGLCVLGV